MLKNVRFVMLTGAVMAVYFAPIVIEANDNPPPAPVKKEEPKKEVKKEPRKKKCPCGKQNGE
jgi:hypothetical protein